MKRFARFLTPFLVLSLGLWACQDQVVTPEIQPSFAKGGSQLTTFELTPLSYVVEGAVFELQVVAIGKKPGEPLTSFNGTVTLTSSSGGIDPGSLTLTKGIGSAGVTLGASSGETVTVTAAAQGMTGEVSLDVGSIGDVYIVYGQSNAVSRAFDGSANGNQSSDPAILTFGAIDAAPGAIGGEHATNPRWHLAEGDDLYALGFIGQWPIRMARQIVDTHQVGVTVLNGAVGGARILELQRNDDDPDDPETIYGRLLNRAQKAGIADQVRAILYYQGESDGIDGMPPEVYEDHFRDLYEDWKTDYPGVSKVYVFQTRGDGCVMGDVPIELRDVQRQFEDEFDDLQVISTTGLDGHDGCHFSYEDGYKTLGETTFRLVSRDFYGSTDTENIDPPYIDRAYFSNSEHTEITLAFRDPDDTLVWDPGSELYFRLEGVTGPSVTSGSANGSTIVLQLSGDASGATGISYLGHGFSGPWVTNSRGVGMLTFYDVPVTGGGGTNSPPTAHFTYTTSDLTASFMDESSDSDGDVVSWSWAFGDGNTSTAQNPSHTYGAAGTYTVTLTVTDDGDATDSNSQDVTVTEPTGGITLSAVGYKVRGRQKADLTWFGAISSQVDVYRDGALLITTPNDGAYTDNIDKVGGGSYTYWVCEAGTSTCSNEAMVIF